MKDRLYAWIVALFFVLCIAGCIHALIAQDKPKPDTTVTLDRGKVIDRLKQIGEAIEKRQKELLDADVQLRQLVGTYNGLAAAIGDTTLFYKEPRKTAK